MAETGVLSNSNELSSLSRNIDDFYNGWYIIAVQYATSSGNVDYYEGIITDYTGSSK